MRRVLQIVLLLAVAALGDEGRAMAAIEVCESTDALIRSITIRSPVRIDESALLDLIPLRRGEALDLEKVAEAERRLLAKAVFRSVTVRCRLEAKGVDVSIELEPRPIALTVDVEGAAALSELEVLRRARIRPGDALDEESLRSAAARIVGLYQDRGYRDVQVRSVVTKFFPGRMKLRFVVEEGEPIRIKAVLAPGVPRALIDSIRGALPFKPGDPWTGDALNRGRRAVLQHLRRKGNYFEAEVDPALLMNEDGALLEYSVLVGPEFVFEVEGNEQLDATTLLELDRLIDRPVITDGTWQQVARRMVTRYEQLGYAATRVEVQIEEQDLKRVRFVVFEGDPAWASAVRVEGNRVVGDSELASVIDVGRTPWNPFRSRGGPLVSATLRDDVARVSELYAMRGYPEARVTRLAVERRGQENHFLLRFVIDEGRPQIVRRVEILGLGDGPPFDVSLQLEPGSFHSEVAAAADRKQIESTLQRRGYPNAAATIESAREELDDRIEIDLTYHVVPGPLVRVGSVIVTGNDFTRDTTVLGKLEVRTGDLLNAEALRRSQSALYRLGLFRSVAVHLRNRNEGLVDVEFQVIERAGGTFEQAFGFDTRSGFRVGSELRQRNVFGRALDVGIRAEINWKPPQQRPDEYLLEFRGRNPSILDTAFATSLQATLQRSTRSIDEFSIEREAIAVGLERNLGSGFRSALGVELDDSRVFDVAADAVLTGTDVGALRTVTINPVLIHEARDDPFSPTRGHFESVRLRLGLRGLGSQVSFVKVEGAHTRHVPLPGDFRWLFSLRGGYADSLDSSSFVPIRERFFVGGRSSVRGFDENEIGPRGQGGRNPIGGDVSVVARTELHIPLFWGLGAATFFDAGGLYLRDRGVTLSGVREGSGIGLRVDTPIGPLRFDYGFKVDRRRSESLGSLHFTIGSAF